VRSAARITGTLLFAAVGLLNLAPGTIALAPSQLATAYGVVDADVTTTLLLRHRAVMLGLLGGALLAAAAVPRWRRAVLVVAVIGKASFIALVATTTGAYPELTSVALADMAALAALAVAAVLTRAWTSPARRPASERIAERGRSRFPARSDVSSTQDWRGDGGKGRPSSARSAGELHPPGQLPDDLGRVIRSPHPLDSH
ncbi:hypothetical protein JYK22_10485, partial [Nonomuraea sp. RK-328]|nr:hypothetical protein [Nonomuraea sp. RK-328]